MEEKKAENLSLKEELINKKKRNAELTQETQILEKKFKIMKKPTEDVTTAEENKIETNN